MDPGATLQGRNLSCPHAERMALQALSSPMLQDGACCSPVQTSLYVDT